MNFIIKNADGSQEGPIDQETLRKWVEIDKVFEDTPVRNALLNNWRTAKDFDFLQEALDAQVFRTAKRKKESKGKLAKILGGGKDDDGLRKKPKEEPSTYFKYEYLPNPAGALKRFLAFLFDWLLIAAFAFALLAAGMTGVYLKALSDTPAGEAPKAAEEAKQVSDKAIPPLDKFSEARPPSKLDNAVKGFHPGSIWTDEASGRKYSCVSASKLKALWCPLSAIDSIFHKLFAFFVFVVLLYFGFSLGFLGQTLGMWFWGLVIVKADGEAVFPLRAFAFSLLLFPLGFLTPFMAYVLPDKRSLHDMLAGVKMIGIAAKPKA